MGLIEESDQYRVPEGDTPDTSPRPLGSGTPPLNVLMAFIPSTTAYHFVPNGTMSWEVTTPPTINPCFSLAEDNQNFVCEQTGIYLISVDFGWFYTPGISPKGYTGSGSIGVNFADGNALGYYAGLTWSFQFPPVGLLVAGTDGRVTPPLRFAVGDRFNVYMSARGPLATEPGTDVLELQRNLTDVAVVRIG